MARYAASSAECSPLAMPVPIKPTPVMMVRASAKSTFASQHVGGDVDGLEGALLRSTKLGGSSLLV